LKLIWNLHGGTLLCFLVKTLQLQQQKRWANTHLLVFVHYL